MLYDAVGVLLLLLACIVITIIIIIITTMFAAWKLSRCFLLLTRSYQDIPIYPYINGQTRDWNSNE